MKQLCDDTGVEIVGATVSPGRESEVVRFRRALWLRCARTLMPLMVVSCDPLLQ
jgi:hypothetical protein